SGFFILIQWGGSAGLISRAAALRHDAFQAKLACVTGAPATRSRTVMTKSCKRAAQVRLIRAMVAATSLTPNRSARQPQQPWQRPHDPESGRADRLGRVARRRLPPRPGAAPQCRRSRRHGKPQSAGTTSTVKRLAEVERSERPRLLSPKKMEASGCAAHLGL